MESICPDGKNCLTSAVKFFNISALQNTAGWSSLVARWAHNPKVAGSNPAPAIRRGDKTPSFLLFRRQAREEPNASGLIFGGICQ